MVSKVLRVYSVSNYANVHGKFVIVPQIRLQGKWVEKLGFTAGSKLMLFADEGIIILKSLKRV
ncbi:MAG TPA: SymE family type I addiction module toxin [Syntrophomonadaceae bacterium]|nr:SymE family type I addiction module toxin [Syntrophomonadaceae bacterium]